MRSNFAKLIVYNRKSIFTYAKYQHLQGRKPQSVAVVVADSGEKQKLREKINGH